MTICSSAQKNLSLALISHHFASRCRIPSIHFVRYLHSPRTSPQITTHDAILYQGTAISRLQSNPLSLPALSLHYKSFQTRNSRPMV